MYQASESPESHDFKRRKVFVYALLTDDRVREARPRQVGAPLNPGNLKDAQTVRLYFKLLTLACLKL